MSNQDFKMPRVKSMAIKNEVEEAIRYHARVNMDNLYTEGLPDECQCSGYLAFRSLVLMKSPLPEAGKARYMRASDLTSVPGTYLLLKLHVLIRERAIECAKEIRKMFKIYDDK
jgi:hypothetical protein